eukprot:scaffold1671_cov344-Pavlova_lutheri.AAC.33
MDWKSSTFLLVQVVRATTGKSSSRDKILDVAGTTTQHQRCGVALPALVASVDRFLVCPHLCQAPGYFDRFRVGRGLRAEESPIRHLQRVDCLHHDSPCLFYRCVCRGQMSVRGCCTAAIHADLQGCVQGDQHVRLRSG